MDMIEAVMIYMDIIENGYNKDGEFMGNPKIIPFIKYKVIVKYSKDLPYLERIVNNNYDYTEFKENYSDLYDYDFDINDDF